MPGHWGAKVSSEKTGSGRPVTKTKKVAGDKSVGEALRAVYRDAVSESVPDEMLDLLKKLG